MEVELGLNVGGVLIGMSGLLAAKVNEKMYGGERRKIKRWFFVFGGRRPFFAGVSTLRLSKTNCGGVEYLRVEDA